MNIQPLNYNFTRKHRLKSDYGQANPNYKNKSVDLCGQENKRGNISFSGGQEQSVAAANTFMGKILKSSTFDWLTKFSGNHNIASSALISLFLAGFLRPAATVALPGKKDKDDKIYAAGHSMASGIMGFGFSTIITSPLDTGSHFMLEDGKKMSKEDFKQLSQDEIRKILAEEYRMDEKDIQKCIDENNAEKIIARKFDKGIKKITTRTDRINELQRKLKGTLTDAERATIKKEILSLESRIKAFDVTMKNVVDWGIAIPRAALTIALIPPILKYVFHLEKGKGKKTPAPVETTSEVAMNAANDTQGISNFMKKSMNDFAGGQR